LLYAEVAVEAARSLARETYTYAVPENIEVVPGHRVTVPFGRRTTYGFVVSLTTEDPGVETKPIATATSVMILLERGQLRLEDRVTQYLPEFGRNGKERVTIEQLLLHTSGLIADNPETDYVEGRAKCLERIYQLKPVADPGSRFIYSDLGYIVLGELIARLAEAPLDEFAHKAIFAPLGMTDTGFRPTGKQKERAAPANLRKGHWIQGEVHDPRAFELGGVAGTELAFQQLLREGVRDVVGFQGPAETEQLRDHAVDLLFTARARSDERALYQGMGQRPDGNRGFCAGQDLAMPSRREGSEPRDRRRRFHRDGLGPHGTDLIETDSSADQQGRGPSHFRPSGDRHRQGRPLRSFHLHPALEENGAGRLRLIDLDHLSFLHI